jgi:PLP dependent protein
MECVADVRRRIAESARAAGRDPEMVTLVAVCKRQPADKVAEALAAGVQDLGENTAQGMARTHAALEQPARWHFVGTLQRNKVSAVLDICNIIHSVDRLPLAEAIAKRAPAGGVEVFVQVNVGREPQKGGVHPDEAVELACRVASQPGLRLRGLMGIPPADVEPRPYFETLARLSEALTATSEGRGARDLSMGMSDDFETAVRCGATIVRVGTALFGTRTRENLT